MKNPELYQKTVDILVQAYFNDTLEHGNDCACAVGNIIAANTGKKFVMKRDLRWEGEHPAWYTVLASGDFHGDEVDLACYTGEAKRQIDSTGYSVFEIAKIERAFELADGYDDEDRMFNGLMAVVNVLDEIHENKEPEITESSKKKFRKEVNLSKSFEKLKTTL